MGIIGGSYGNGISADVASIIYDELVRYKRAAESKNIKGAPKDVEGQVRGSGLTKVDADARIFLEEFARSFKVDINVIDESGDGSLGSANALSRRITLSVKSANNLSTLLHELGHLMQVWDSETFYAIQDAVCDWFAKYNNTTLEDLIEARQAEYSEKEGKPCSYREAKDEVTCNAIEAIQTAESFAEEFTQTMAELQYPKAEAEGKLTALQSFFRKIKLALNNIIARLKKKRGGNLMITAEGKVISKDVAMVNDLLKKVRQGLVNVRTNYDAYVAGAEVKGTGDGTIRHMYESDDFAWRYVEYSDEQTQKHIISETHKQMVDSGAIVNVPKEIINRVEQLYPDLRHLKKKERRPILKNAVQILKGDIRNFLNGLTKQDFEFEIDGKILEARLYSTGIDEVMDHITQQKANMLYITPEIFNNARYLYSTDDYSADENIYRWNYFYTPVQIGEEIVGVRIAIRDIKEGRIHKAESQIYHWGIKKDTSLDGMQPVNNDSSHGVSSDVSDNNIPQKPPVVNTNSPTDSDTEHKQHLSSEEDEQAMADEILASRNAHKAAALKEFGTTRDFAQTGFVTDDGRMLNLSQYGQRGVQHKIIERVLDGVTGERAVTQFINEGNVRIKATSPGIEISAETPLTTNQLNVVSRFISANLKQRGVFYLDITDTEGNDVASVAYDDGYGTESILWDIKDYYRRGIVPSETRYQHLSSEADEQAKADEIEALREENKALKRMDKKRWEMIDYLQKQLNQWRRGGKKLDYRGIKKLAHSLIKEYGADLDVKAYAKELTSFFNYMTNNNKGVREKNMFKMQAYKTFEDVVTGENAAEYESAMYDTYGHEYTDDTGRTFRISKMQAMQVNFLLWNAD